MLNKLIIIFNKHNRIFYLTIIIISILYIAGLSKSPVYLNQDELGFSLNAYSIAKTGFDDNGSFLPFYFWHLGVMWSTPIIVYLTAIVLTFLPLSEVSIRLPSVFVGITSITLIYFLSIRIFKSKRLAILAAVFLALTPVHFIHSRILLDNLYSIVFVLVWLFCLSLFLEKKNLWYLFISMISLGIGVHSYHSAKVMMTLYLLFTIVILSKKIYKRKLLLFVLLAGFSIPLVPLIFWLQQYPDTLIDQVRYTQLYDINLTPWQGLLTLLTPESLYKRANVYLAYFDFRFLFFVGDSSLIHSTHQSGVFLISYLLLLPVGIIRAFKVKSIFSILTVVGFFTAPFAAVLVGEYYRISRALVILPFATLLVVWGVEYLLSLKNRIALIVLGSLLVLIPLQFGLFVLDYFTDYRLRAYGWFNYNIPGSLEKIISEEKNNKISMIFLDNSVYFIDRYWRFYLIKNNKLELLNKTRYINTMTFNIHNVSSQSLLLYSFNNLTSEYPINSVKVLPILEPDASVNFYVIKNIEK